MPDLDKIKNVVIVMMENRSFDHMLGYLSLPPFNRADVAGQSLDPAWLSQFTNFDAGQASQPFLSTNPYTMPNSFDPPHERPNVAAQIDPRQDNSFPMNGFISAIPTKVSNDPAVRNLVMSYFGAEQAPINQFFASHFTICDRWFCSLPAGTQPNRLMSMSGFSMIDVNQTPLPDQSLVYDWLNSIGVSWRVYHRGVPFFAMMPKWMPAILFDTDHFKSFDDFAPDLLNNPPDKLPQVIFIEPTYGDAPRVGHSTDDHAPAGIANGQEFLMQIYNAVMGEPFWQSALLIIDYDEHGGFFDHAAPPLIRTDAPAGAKYTTPFASLGVRTPAYLISPFVEAGAVSHNLLDHTSVLKFLGEKFNSGSYSPLVDSRPVGSISHVLDFSNPLTKPAGAPALDAYLAARPPAPAGVTIPTVNTELQRGFSDAIASMKQHGAGATHPKFGPLLA
jgi:phospholipase C